MNSGIRRRQWTLVVGALATGIVALGLGLELENASAVEKRAESSVLSKVSASSAAKETSSRPTDFFGQLPGGGYPTIVTAPVDYRDDEGTRLRRAGLLKGPMPFLFDNAVATGGCTFDIECDDGDPCIIESCDFIVGSLPGTGKCVYTAAPDGTDAAHGGGDCRVGLLCGGCDDDLPCNGVETCQAGACVPPGGAGPATCCTDAEAEGGTTECTNTLARCNEASLNAGDVCLSDAQCAEDPNQSGTKECEICQPTCTVDADCADEPKPKKCNGVETCVGGVCKAGVNPCGAAADCDEGVCSNDASVDCSLDEDCSGGTCDFAEAPTCYEGRCCRTDGGGPSGSSPEEPACLKKGLAFCTGKGFFYASDEGRHILDPEAQKCGNHDEERPGDAWACPKYSSGISQLDAASPPQYGPPVGPISDSLQPVNTPRANYDVGGPLNRLGDNYEFLNGSFMEIEVFRFVGGMAVPNRILIEIWDDADPPNFVEDLIISPLGETLSTIVVPFVPPLPIASRGWITLRVANTFTPNAEIVWRPTSSGVTTGINTPDQIWVNDGPVASFLNPGDVLAFEIAGNKIDPPVGACCDAGTGTCDGKLSWVCKQDGDSFLGTGIACDTCTGGDNIGGNCRTCQGGGDNDGTVCLRDADCDSGTCATDASVCTGGVCDNDPEAPCSGGDCGMGNTCILSTCELTIRCTKGACCTDGTCAETVGGSCTGPSAFLGFGTLCDIDDGADFGEQHCCLQLYDDTNADLPARCVGDGADNGSACTDGTECDSGNCDALTCAPSATGAAGSVCTDRDSCDSRSCVATDDLYDNQCADGTCWTGADNCEEAITHQIPVPGQGDDPIVITITGSNAFATASEEFPDSCPDVDVATDVNDDLGWYESFEIDECAMVRLDTCCTEGVFKPSYTFLYTPGESGDPCACDSSKGRDADPFVFGQPSFARGEPYCTLEDNIWFTHGPLPAGKYTFLLLSRPASHLGPYQMHITVKACPEAACCLPDGSCVGNVNALECAEIHEGFHLAPPNVALASSVGLCTENPCDLGSCCFGPGKCDDFDANNVRYTEALCTDDMGQFFGGIRCGGGFCTDAGGFLTDTSCSGVADCEAAGLNECIGDEEQLEQPPVCPVCTINTEATCQRDPGTFSGTAYLADTSSATQPTRIADDVLITETRVLETACVIAVYVNFDGGATDCSQEPGFDEVADDFTVKVYSTDGDLYRPGTLLGEWSTLISENEDTPEFGTGFRFWRHELTLIATTGNPLIELQQGEIYWIEISNNTAGGPIGCNWYWLNAEDGEGNGIFFQDLCEEYTLDDAEDGDISLCLNVPFETPQTPIRACCTGEIADPCVANTLVQCTAIGGDWQFGQGGDTPCSNFVCPAATNDACADALFVEEGSFTFNLFNTTTDGPEMHDCSAYNQDTGQVEIEVDEEYGNDIWYFYTPTATGSAYISACNCERFGDEIISIYHDPGNPTVCPCPADDGFSFLECWDGAQQNVCNPNGCTTFGDHPEVVMDVVLGNCYTIQVAGDASSEPRGDLRIALGGACCGDGTRQVEGGEQCDGDDDSLCPGQCNGNCLCPPPVCGDGVAAVDLGEECDGAIDTVCTDRNTVCNTAICECVPKCGNNVKEPGEQCDGADSELCPNSCIPEGDPEECRCDATCGNEIVEVGEACDGSDDSQCPGRCESDCTCPPTECGNDVVDGKLEECDGVDDARCPDQCRLPGDPAGECTCQCAVTVEPPPATETPLPNDKGDEKAKNRFISMSIPPAAVASVHETAIEVVLTTLNRRCQQGLLNQFEPCSEDADCPGGVCDKPFATTRCQGGSNNNGSCVNDGDCPGTVCEGTITACETSDDCAEGVSCVDATCTRTGREGSVRYVNLYKVCDGTISGCLSSADCGGDACVASLFCPDDVFQPAFPCAVLGCEPEFRDWAGELAGATLHVFGEGIVPGRSAYDVAQVPVACEGDVVNCPFKSPSLRIVTARWGDLNADGATNALDIARASNKLTVPPPGAFTKPRIMLVGSLLKVYRNVSVLELQNTIDAVSSIPQTGLIAGPQSCPSD